MVGPMLKHHRQVSIKPTIHNRKNRKRSLTCSFSLVHGDPRLSVPADQDVDPLPSGWRNYVIAPLLPIVPLCLYSLVGLGMETAYWIIFLFRYFPAALAYLLIVWGSSGSMTGDNEPHPPLRRRQALLPSGGDRPSLRCCAHRQLPPRSAATLFALLAERDQRSFSRTPGSAQ